MGAWSNGQGLFGSTPQGAQQPPAPQQPPQPMGQPSGIGGLLGQATPQSNQPVAGNPGWLQNILGFLMGRNALSQAAGNGSVTPGVVPAQDDSQIKKAVADYMKQQQDKQKTVLQSTKNATLPQAIMAAPAKKGK